MKKFVTLFGSLFLISALISCSALSSEGEGASLSVQLPAKSAARAAADSNSDESTSWKDNIVSYTIEIALAQSQTATREAASTNAAEDSSEQSTQEQTDSQAQTSAPYRTKDAKPGELIRFEEIPAGQYTVKVFAKDSSSNIIGGGEKNTQVEEGKTTTVPITISEYKTSDDDSPSEEDEKTATVTLESISVDTSKATTSYTVGDQFSSEGLVVTAAYSDTTTKM